ncbi:MAG: TRAP transporter small permease subunit [Myxococcota bacterium]
MRPLLNLIDAMNARLGQAVSWLCLLMVALGAINAIARYAGKYLGASLLSTALSEGQWYLFSLLFLLGAAWTLQRDRHVRVDVFYGRLSKRRQAILNLIGALVLLLPFCVFGIWASVDYVTNSFAQQEMSPDPGGLPRYPIKAAIPAAFVLLILQGLRQIVGYIEVIRGAQEERDA